MAHFSYHNKIQSKIKNGLLANAEFCGNYKDYGLVLLLTFKDGEVYPIREHKIDEYLILINSI